MATLRYRPWGHAWRARHRASADGRAPARQTGRRLPALGGRAHRPQADASRLRGCTRAGARWILEEGPAPGHHPARHARVFRDRPDGTPKVVMSPLQQARHCAIQVVNALERDPQLVQGAGRKNARLAFPGATAWSSPTSRASSSRARAWARPFPRTSPFGTRWSRTGRRSVPAAAGAMSPHLLAARAPSRCRSSTACAGFSSRSARAPAAKLFGPARKATTRTPACPTSARDGPAAKRQLAFRSLGDGHRVIHGVAGSGKTMILGYKRRAPGANARPGQQAHPHPLLQRAAIREAGRHHAG